MVSFYKSIIILFYFLFHRVLIPWFVLKQDRKCTFQHGTDNSSWAVRGITTSNDVVIQLLFDLIPKTWLSIIWFTHDLDGTYSLSFHFCFFTAFYVLMVNWRNIVTVILSYSSRKREGSRHWFEYVSFEAIQIFITVWWCFTWLKALQIFENIFKLHSGLNMKWLTRTYVWD